FFSGLALVVYRRPGDSLVRTHDSRVRLCGPVPLLPHGRLRLPGLDETDCATPSLKELDEIVCRLGHDECESDGRYQGLVFLEWKDAEFRDVPVESQCRLEFPDPIQVPVRLGCIR